MKISGFVSTVICSASLVSAYDASKRCNDRTKYPDLCLESFVWCDDNAGNHCSFPEGVYPHSVSSPYNFPLVRSDKDFVIQWKANDMTDTRPVTFRWSFGKLNWSTNVTGTSFTFNAAKILDSFPTQDWPNATAADAWYEVNANADNILSISRVGETGSDDGHEDSSQTFNVDTDQYGGAWLDTQRALEYNKWRFGVGIGVGLGVPVLLAITAFATWFVTKRKLTRGMTGSRAKGEHTELNSL